MATTTPQDIIKGAFRSIGALAGGETPAPDMLNDAFDLMNDLLEMYSNQKQLIFAIQEVFHNLTSGLTSTPSGLEVVSGRRLLDPSQEPR